jgi:hypothetical protein
MGDERNYVDIRSFELTHSVAVEGAPEIRCFVADRRYTIYVLASIQVANIVSEIIDNPLFL